MFQQNLKWIWTKEDNGKNDPENTVHMLNADQHFNTKVDARLGGPHFDSNSPCTEQNSGQMPWGMGGWKRGRYLWYTL